VATQAVVCRASTTYVRDGAGNIVSITGPNGHTSIFTYDDMNRKLTQTDPYGNTTTFTYVCAGTNASSCSCCSGESAKVASVTDPLGHITSFEYDGVGNMVKQTDPLGHFRTMTYDLNLNLETVADEMGRLTSFEYDAAGRQTAVVAPGGARRENIFDAMGRVIANIDPLGRVTSFEYDMSGRQTAQIDALGGRTEFSYDAAGNCVSVADAKGHASTFTYDALNRLLTETDPLGRTHPRTYDAAGRLASATDAKGQTITFTYDDADRLTSKNYPDGARETYVYDASGNLLNATNPAVSMSYTYDDRNLQLTIVNDTISKTVGYTYDGNGRKVSLTYPDGETISYTRDARGQVIHLASNQPGPGGEPPPTVDYAYNPDGSLAAMDYGFGLHVARIYDPVTGRLIDLRYTKPDGTVISDFAYTHDATGNILSKTTDFGLVQYGYDSLDRLVLADYDWKADETFAYDAVGNRTADAGHPVWQYDAANPLLAYGAGPHDPAGETPPEVPNFSFAYDANGSTVSKADLASCTTGQYGYSFDNRMSKVRRDGELVAQYSYDHMSQRVRKDLFSSGVLTGATWFVYGHEGLLAEFGDSGALVRKYAWQPGGPRSTAAVWQNGGAALAYPIADHLGPPMQAVDGSLSTLLLADWDAFGLRAVPIQSCDHAFGFPGQYRDAETGLLDNWHRQYDPVSGRYYETDPVGLDGGLNVFAYAGGNPVTSFDEAGLAPSKEEGLAQLPAAEAKMQAMCDCCVEASMVEQCKADATKITQKIVSLWDRYYGTGKSTHWQAVGGYWCWDWAEGFRIVSRGVQSRIWKAKLRGFYKKEIPHESRPMHAATRLFIEKPIQRCGEGNNCELTVDYGFFHDGFVHDYGWPENGKGGYYEERWHPPNKILPQLPYPHSWPGGN